MSFFKHVGKVNGKKVIIVKRSIGGDEPHMAVVIYSDIMPQKYHDDVMKILESTEGQASFELGTYLNRVSFPDGTNMLAFLHQGNYIKKMPTANIIVTMGSGTDGEVSLDELNKLIAEERGVKVSELAVADPTPKQTADASKKKTAKK